MWSRSELKAKGKAAFKRNYWKCVLVAFILGLITSSAGTAGSTAGGNTATEDTSGIYYEDMDILKEFDLSSVGGAIFTTITLAVILVIFVIVLILSIFIFNPLEVGCCNFFKNNAYKNEELNALTIGFKKDNYMKMVGTIFMRNLYIFLWSLLLVVPGIIKSLEYRMVPYILADCPDISRENAFRISKEMMMGNKMDAFILDLSFIGWYFLAAITCNIAGIFYVQPYKAATDAELFITVRENYFKSNHQA